MCTQWKRAERQWIRRNLTGLSCRAPLEITRCFGYIWIHLDTFGASTFDAAFDAYVLARVTRSCLAVPARVSLTYDWQALQQELELARTPRWHPSFCDFDTLTAFDDVPCNALRARQAAEAEDAAEVSEPWHVSLVLRCFLSFPIFLTLFKCFSRHSGYNRSKTP